MEDVKRVKNAAEAKAIKEQNAMGIDRVLDIISFNVQNGSITIPEYIHISTISKLMELGFSVSYRDGNFGENVVKIEW